MLSDRICQLNVRSSIGDSRALRMGVSQMLNAVDFRPSGMSPSAILMVDKIVGTMPKGSVSGSSFNSRAALAAKKQWESALKERLDSAYKKALRPHKGRLSGSSKAVVFNDQTELVACLCRDIIDGNANRKWWWKRTYADKFLASNISSALTSCLLDNAKSIPMVVDTLAEWDQGIALVKQLNNNDAETLLAAVLHAFSFSGLAAKLEGVGSDPTTDENNASVNSCITDSQSKGEYDCSNQNDHHESGATRPDQSPAHYADRGYRRSSYREDNMSVLSEFAKSRNRSAQALVYPPWMPMFDAQGWDRSLGRVQACLLGVARLAASKPQVLRNCIFEDQIVDWWKQTEGDEVNDEMLSGYHSQIDESQNGFSQDSHLSSSYSNGAAIDRDIEDSFNRSSHVLDDTEKSYSNKLNKQHVSNEANDGVVVGNNMDDTVDPEHQIGVGASVEQTSDDVTILSDASNVNNTRAKRLDSQHGDGDIEGKVGSHIIANALAGDDLVTGIPSVEASKIATEKKTDNLYLQGGQFDTELSGCFYLINLLAQLELPECMDERWGIDQVFSRWALLELVSRSLIGNSISDFNNDPIWNLLENLDDRNTKSRIGEQLKSYPDYYLPQDWWRYLIEHDATAHRGDEQTETASYAVEVHWAMQRETLRIWFQGCIIVERKIKLFGLDLDARDAKKYDEIKRKIVNESLQAYRESGCVITLVQSGFEKSPTEAVCLHNKKYISPSMQRWASLTIPFIRYYLKHQLSLDSVDEKTLIETLFQFPSRVYLTSSHIDVVADLKHTRLDVRCSGLDQNPGWLPMFGRVFQFHFSSSSEL